MPKIFTEGEEGEIFQQAFEKANLATMSHTEQEVYQRSLKTYRDMYSVVTTARDEGVEEGFAIGKVSGLQEALQQLIASGMDEDDARKILGLNV